MSDILIKGMKIPTSCIACHLNFGEKRPEYGLTIFCPYSEGVISWRDKAFNNGRLSSCGIVSIPPHGRLIDADTIGLTNFEIILCKQEQEPYKEALKMVLDKIEKSPTIIPSDKESGE